MTFNTGQRLPGGWIWFSLLLLFSISSTGECQNGDRAGEVQQENWRKWNVPEAPVLSPSEALEAFQIAPGFSIQLVASEPQVVDPVAIAWDETGRLWVVELRGYMRTVDGDGETEAVGQVAVLEDLDGDGFYETRHLFLDQLINPRAISIVEGGVLIGEPPHLWYCQDLDGDFRCDRRTEVSHYGTDDPDHVEHTDNGLLRTLDNWIYNAKSQRKFRFDLVEGKPVLSESPTAFRGQWGLAQDDFGRLYYNHNSTWILTDPLPTELLLANPWSGRAIGQPARSGQTVIPDPSTYPIRINPGINRGYQKPMLRADGRLQRNTAASGVAILRSDQWGADWDGRAFVPEAAGNLVAAFELQENSGRFQGQQLLWPHSKYGQRAFLASTDERFRPVDAKLGPDGNLYIIDMYRGIIQHRQFVTSYLRKQIEERKLAEPVGLGRIWKIVRHPGDLEGTPSLSGLPLLQDVSGQLKALSHPVGWIRDTAQRLLVESRSENIAGDLREILNSGQTSTLGKIHALRVLDGIGVLSPKDLSSALSASDRMIRRIGFQIFAEKMPHSDEWHQCREFLKQADDEPEETLDVIHRLIALATLKDDETALSEVLAILRKQGHSPQIRLAAISQWDDYQIERLSRFLAADFQTDDFDGLEPLLNELVRSALLKDKHSFPLILTLIEDLDTEDRRLPAVIAGIHFVMSQKRWKPPHLSEPPKALIRNDFPIGLAKPVEMILGQIELAETPAETIQPWTEEERRLAKSGARAFASSCSSCHGAGGQGLPGLGPSLIGSPWLLGDEKIPIKIILDGLTGPITVDGEEWDLTMPGHRENPKLKDADIAGLLTWIRRQWGHLENPISPETVTKTRQETAKRNTPWTDSILRKGTQ